MLRSEGLRFLPPPRASRYSLRYARATSSAGIQLATSSVMLFELYLCAFTSL